VSKKVLSVLLFLLLVGMGYVYIPRFWYPPDKVRVTIYSGMSAQKVAGILKKEGIIKSTAPFLYWLAIKGAASRIKAGTYEIFPQSSLNSIVKKIVEGRTLQVKVTIPEGYTARQIASILGEKGVADKEKFLKIVERKNMEGYLFPETYFFPLNISEEEIVKVMNREFEKNFSPWIRERAKKYNFTERDVVILASLIEREAKTDEERRIVSAVFHNRLKKRWRLESCATVQYAMGKWKSRLYQKDLKIDSPYNTYKHFGLPPGPIANPGLASLEAAVTPADTDAMFFVADGEGTHIFSKYLAEHIKNKKTLKKRR